MSITVEMKWYACQACGFIYSVPQSVPDRLFDCPSLECSSHMRDARRIGEQSDRIEQLDRRVAALQGVITRLKNLTK